MKIMKIERSGLRKQPTALCKLGYKYQSANPYDSELIVIKEERSRCHLWFAYQLDKGNWTLEKNAKPRYNKYIRIVALGTAAEIEQLILRRLNRPRSKGRQASNRLLKAMPLVAAHLVARELEL